MTITITARENFHNQLERWHNFNDEADKVEAEHLRLNLIQACGAMMRDTGQVPQNYWHAVRDAIANWKDADDWETSGHKYSTAARLISFRLKQ